MSQHTCVNQRTALWSSVHFYRGSSDQPQTSRIAQQVPGAVHPVLFLFLFLFLSFSAHSSTLASGGRGWVWNAAHPPLSTRRPSRCLGSWPKPWTTKSVEQKLQLGALEETPRPVSFPNPAGGDHPGPSRGSCGCYSGALASSRNVLQAQMPPGGGPNKIRNANLILCFASN